MRIDNVETKPAERITANDEDRQRRGFEIQTIFAWPRRDGLLDVASAIATDSDGPILRLDYASGATISRLNKGLRRVEKRASLVSASTRRLAAGLEVKSTKKERPLLTNR